MVPLLFLVPVHDSAIGSFLIPSGNGVPGLSAIVQFEFDEMVLAVVPECGVWRQRNDRETQLLTCDGFCCRRPRPDALLSPSRQPRRRLTLSACRGFNTGL